jgi:alpha-amylase
MFIRPAVVASLFACIFASSASTEEQSGRPWNHEIVYSVLLDRFFDGDPSNNVPLGSDPALYDKAQQDIDKYHGGDLRGLEMAIQRRYFKDLGITALAISSPVKNVWFSQGEGESAKTGYTGDWPQDFLDIDPHWTSAKSADNKADYANSRDGRLQHYKDFVALAHSTGLRVIQDVVLNHAGPVFFYDINGNGQFDVDARDEWVPPFKRDGGYDAAVWANLPKWNAVKTAPGEPVTVLGRELKVNGVLAQLETYGRYGYSETALAKDEEGKQCDVFSRRDLNTHPNAPHFKKLVDDFVEIYAFYIEAIGVDGLRMHLLKQTHRAFWDEFTAGLRKRVGPDRAKELILIGHVNDSVPSEIGKYTYRKDREDNDNPTFDTVVNTPFTLAVREYLRQSVGPYGNASAVEKGWSSLMGRRDGANLHTMRGADGLTALQKVVNQIEGADGANRFRVSKISEKQNILANALAIFSEGIPVLYYGTEAGITDAKGKIGKDGESGRLTLIPAGLLENFDHIRKTRSFQSLAAFNEMRKKLPPLQDGAFSPLWSDSPSSDTDDGIFGFVRYIRSEDGEAPADFTIVVINASERPRATSAGTERMKLVSRSGRPLVEEGQKLVRLPVAGLDGANAREQTINVVWYGGKPQVELLLAPQTVNIYQLAR